MKCLYCSAFNSEEDHRCKKCGRRVGSPSAEYQHSAAAPALEEEVQQDHVQVPGLPRKPVFQPSLFSNNRVVAFESFAPESVEPPAKKPSRPRQKTHKQLPGQQSFGFETVSYQSPAQPMQTVIGCDAPVAIASHRVIAAALDISVVIVAVSLFSLIFHLAGGSIVLSKQTLPLVIAIPSVVFLLYKSIWCFADTDTAGMRWAHLRLVDFDGNPPQRQQRFYRLASGFLSLLAAGLGLLWALVDEESLTWHDHISKTFPTPY